MAENAEAKGNGLERAGTAVPNGTERKEKMRNEWKLSDVEFRKFLVTFKNVALVILY